ncbi:DNA-binding protein, partial [Pseudomonas qingdaonensis]
MPSSSSAPVTPKRRFYLRWPFGLAVAAVIGYGVAVAMHWDDRGALWVKESFESIAER